jgi:hypothetical protein
VHDKMHPPGFGAKADGCRKVLALTHAMDRGQQGRLKRTTSRVPCADGWPEWRGRHGSACADGSRAYGHDGGCWADTYACSRVVPHAGGGVISDARSRVPDQRRLAPMRRSGSGLSTATARSQIYAL